LVTPVRPHPQFDLNTGGSVFAFAYASDHTNFATDPPTPGSFWRVLFRPRCPGEPLWSAGGDPGRERNGFRQRERCHRRYTRTPIPAALPLFAAVSVWSDCMHDAGSESRSPDKVIRGRTPRAKCSRFLLA